MPGQKPDFHLQAKPQASLPDAALEALASSRAQIPFALDEALVDAFAFTDAAAHAGQGAGHRTDLSAILANLPIQATERVNFLKLSTVST